MTTSSQPRYGAAVVKQRLGYGRDGNRDEAERSVRRVGDEYVGAAGCDGAKSERRRFDPDDGGVETGGVAAHPEALATAAAREAYRGGNALAYTECRVLRREVNAELEGADRGLGAGADGSGEYEGREESRRRTGRAMGQAHAITTRSASSAVTCCAR